MKAPLWFKAAALAAAVMTTATGCGSAPVSGADSTAAKSITITDALDRTLELDEPPQSIVAAGRGNSMVLNLLYTFPEAPERVVAMENSRDTSTGEFLSLLEPSYGKKRILEQNSGPEQIAPIKPDIVILKSYLAQQLGPQYDALGIPVAYVELETPENFFHDLKTVGEILDNEARAEEIRAFYRERLDRVEEATKDLPESEKPRVLVVSYSDKGGDIAFQVSPPGWMQSAQVEMAGGIPVWLEAGGGDNWTVVTFEQIAAWDPDFVFVIAYRMNPADVVAKLKENPQWQSLRCVKEDRLYPFPADVYSWDMPDTRWILGVTWLTHTLHPDRMPLDVGQEVRDFFGELYGMDESSIEGHMLPAVEMVLGPPGD